MSTPRLPSIRRFFQPQIPQALRPALTSVLASTLGRVNLEAPAAGLTAIAYWAKFSRWCRRHPMLTTADGKEDLYRVVIENESLRLAPFTYLEFGVYRGDSLRWWLAGVEHPESRFVGFDTFTGLPERWRATEPEGHFNANGSLPDFNDLRCNFEVGLFQKTLPAFVANADLTGRLVINLDADMFTSTLFVLTTMAPFLKPGDLIFFDEFSCPLDEFRAFDEFVRSFRREYELIGAVYGYTRVCIKVR